MKLKDPEPKVPKETVAVSDPATQSLPVIQMETKTKIELPSKCLSYPKDATVSYRPYTFGELVKLSQSILKEDGKIEMNLLGVETSFDKKELVYFDFLYLITMRKLSTLNSPKFTITHTCYSCGSKSKHEQELAKLDFKEAKIPALPITVPFTYEGKPIELKISFFTVGNFLFLFKNNKHRDAVAILASMVRNYPFDEAYKIIDSATGDDIDKIEKIDKITEFGLKNIKYTCSECQAENAIDLTDEEEIVLDPFRVNRAPVEDCFRFGV